MTDPIYILKNVPGAAPSEGVKVVDWLEIANDKARKIVIFHEARRSESRWVSVDRKRPFIVNVNKPSSYSPLSSHTTLAAAVKSAKKFASRVTP